MNIGYVVTKNEQIVRGEDNEINVIEDSSLALRTAKSIGGKVYEVYRKDPLDELFISEKEAIERLQIENFDLRKQINSFPKQRQSDFSSDEIRVMLFWLKSISNKVFRRTYGKMSSIEKIVPNWKWLEDGENPVKSFEEEVTDNLKKELERISEQK